MSFTLFSKGHTINIRKYFGLIPCVNHKEIVLLVNFRVAL